MKGWEMINRVKTMLSDGKTVSHVARELRIDRKTVRKYREMKMDEIAEYYKKRRYRKKKVDVFRSFIDNQLELMEEDGVINAQAIFDKIIGKGFSGAPRTLRRYIFNRIGKRTKQKRIYEPFETDPGKQAMVDMGESRKAGKFG